MGNTTKKKLKIMILEDEEDILTLYNDYLSSKGHQVVNRYLSPDSIMNAFQKETPDVYLIDYRLPGNKNGIDVAMEILNKFPSAPILFITAYEPLYRKVSKNPIFYDKNIEILLKPAKLDQIENSMLNLVNKKRFC
jgi:DNA-binding NtrC family response regulator